VVATVGCAIIGQTDNIVPADKRIYALRDVTSTIESIPLICSSILSKKFAEDINGIVFDIKVGNGAFMKRKEDAIRLANNLIKISNAFNKKAACVLTNMDYPLGYAVGNWLEVVETVHCLKGIEVPDVMEITHTIAGVMLTMGSVSKGIYEGIELSKKAIISGMAYNKFLEMVSAQGGDTLYLENLEKYDISKYVIEIKSDKEGYISNIDAREIGLLGIEIGIGRKKVNDTIDYKSGIIFRKTIGDMVKEGDILAMCYTEKEDILKLVKNRIFDSFTISKTPVKKDSPIISIMGDVNL
jgi:pyrimidine-nucleoside phosphorylase